MEKFNNIKQSLLSNWNLWRITRLVLSIVFMLAGTLNKDYILLAAGVFLLIQALVNTCATCVGSNNCETPKNKKS